MRPIVSTHCIQCDLYVCGLSSVGKSLSHLLTTRFYFFPILELSIGWKYGDTHRRKINDYERSRASRKVNLDFVLTRSEREALLLEFDVDARSIVSSTRAALKTKFQRKQTVVNARKFSKLEEVIENTSRRLKKALLPRRLMNHGSDDILELAPSPIFESEQSGSGETVSISSGDEDTKSKIHVMEPDEDTIEKLMQSTFDFPAVSVCDDGDDDASITDEFTLGATTLGNTSALSPSIMEIEKFYKDLELEMFGEELPSMVGQTLEVPLDAEGRDASLKSITSEGTMFQNEMSIDRNHRSTSQMPHLEKFPSPPYRDESQSRSYDENAWGDAQDPPYNYNAFQNSARSTFDQYDFVERNCDQPSFTKDESLRFSGEYEQRYNHSMNHPIYPHPSSQHQSFPFSQSGFDPHYTQYPFGYYEQIGSQTDSYRHHRHRRNGSFDSSSGMAKTQNSMQYSEPTSRVQEFEQSHFRPQSLPTEVDFSVRRNSDPVDRSPRRSSRSRRSSRDSNSPRVRHVPLHGHLSANQWMDGSDTEFGRNKNALTVTITEGD
jgi:hypothetical protein